MVDIPVHHCGNIRDGASGLAHGGGSLPSQVYSGLLERRHTWMVDCRIQEEPWGFRPGRGRGKL